MTRALKDDPRIRVAYRTTPGEVRHHVMRSAAGLLWMIMLCYYGLLGHRTGQEINENKDFSHLWIGGRMIADLNADYLYDPPQQEAAYRRAAPDGRPPAVWIERNRVVGAFFYPPPTAVVYALVAWLPMRTAATINAYINIGLAIVLTWVLARRFPRCESLATAGIMVLAFPAMFVTLSLGQNAICTTLVLLLGWHFCDDRKEVAAGVVWGLLIFKPSWLVAVVWMPLFHRRWRVLGGMAASSAAVIMLTVMVTGPEPFGAYLEELRRLKGLHELPGYNLSLTYNGLSVFRKWFGLGVLADVLGVISAAGMIAATVWVTRTQWHPGSPNFRYVAGIAIIAGLWVNPHLFYYDLMPLLIAMMIILTDGHDRRGLLRASGVIVVMVGYAAIPWDDLWNLKHVVPVPNVVIAACWVWFMLHLRDIGRCSGDAQPCSGNRQLVASGPAGARCLETGRAPTS